MPNNLGVVKDMVRQAIAYTSPTSRRAEIEREAKRTDWTPDQRIIDLSGALCQPLRQYHHHKVLGLENIPTTGRAILAINHSLATYDSGLLKAVIDARTNRIVRPLGDNALFALRPISALLEAYGALPGHPSTADMLMDNDQLIMVAPGGMMEALRPSTAKYQIRWERRKGFVRLAVRHQAPIILAACPAADDIYTMVESGLTKSAYEKLRLPLPVARGIGISPLPRPVRLVHLLSEPLQPPKLTAKSDESKLVDTFHQQVIDRMNELMHQALQYSHPRP